MLKVVVAYHLHHVNAYLYFSLSLVLLPIYSWLRCHHLT